jgi:hypothetical protein
MEIFKVKIRELGKINYVMVLRAEFHMGFFNNQKSDKYKSTECKTPF